MISGAIRKKMRSSSKVIRPRPSSSIGAFLGPPCGGVDGGERPETRSPPAEQVHSEKEEKAKFVRQEAMIWGWPRG